MAEIDLKNRALVEREREETGVTLDDLLTPEVRDFCVQQSILQYVRVAMELAQCHFSAQDLSIRLTQDPETDEEWVVMEITVQDEVDRVLEAHNRYTDQWVASVPWPERDRIVLSYDIL